MCKHQFCFFSMVALLFAVPPSAAARRDPDPCEQRDILEQQIRDLKLNQSNELKQCQAANGKTSYICKDMKANQKAQLKLEEASLQAQLNDCRSPMRKRAFPQIQANNENYYNTNYHDDRHHHRKCDPDRDGDNDCHHWKGDPGIRPVVHATTGTSPSHSGNGSSSGGGYNVGSGNTGHSGGGVSAGGGGGSSSSGHSSGGGSVSSRSSSSSSSSSSGHVK